MKSWKSNRIRNVFFIAGAFYLHYNIAFLWVSITFHDQLLNSLFFFHLAIVPSLMSFYFDVDYSRFTGPFRRKVSFILKTISLICLVVFLYHIFVLIADNTDSISLQSSGRAVISNAYILISLMLIGYTQFGKDLKEELVEAHSYFYSLFRNCLTLTIITFFVQSLLLLVPGKLVLFLGLTSLGLLGLDQMAMILKMFIYHNDYFKSK